MGCPVDYGDYAPFGIDAISNRWKQFVSAQAITLKHLERALAVAAGSQRKDQEGRSGSKWVVRAVPPLHPLGRSVGKVDFRPDRKLHL